MTGPGRAALDALTERERVVAEAALRGTSNRGIAVALGLSARTVEHHLSHVYRKLGLEGRSELLARFAAAPTGADLPELPAVRYTEGAGPVLAYQVVGHGPVDMVLVQGLVSHLEVLWEDPGYVDFVERLSTFCRLVLFDKRGTGLSEPVSPTSPPSLEERMDDLRLVMDAAGSERAVVLGGSEGGPLSVRYAAAYPQHVLGLVLYGSWGWRDEQHRQARAATLEHVRARWGTGEFLGGITPSAMADDAGQRYMARLERNSANPATVTALVRMSLSTNVRDVLPTVRVPTLVVHRTDDRGVPVTFGRGLADAVPGARMVELPGVDHYPWYGDTGSVVAAIRDFVEGLHQPVEGDSSLTAVLAVHPDSSLLSRNVPAVAAAGGRLASAGGSPVGVFPTPSAAVGCAVALAEAAGERASAFGVHVGECRLGRSWVSGDPVHVVRALAAAAEPGSVRVSGTVRDLLPPSSWRLDPAEDVSMAPGRSTAAFDVAPS